MSTAVYSTDSLREQNAKPFSSMAGRVNPFLLKALQSHGYDFMTPVQGMVLSKLPSYTSDCLVQAKTGTGKTIAFLLPALHSILSNPTQPNRGQVQVLILSPTRELAMQIAKECDLLTSQLPRPLECHTAFGGTARASNLNKFMNGNPTVLAATPGRLLDYLSDAGPRSKLRNIRTVILDEADTMLEKGFLADVSAILGLLPAKSEAGWQGMCFSATMPDKVMDVVGRVLKPGHTSISTVDQNEAPTVDGVPQFSVILPSLNLTFSVLLNVILKECQSGSKIIVFGVTANMVALFASVFQNLTPLKVYQLQSRLNQNIRTRTTEEFKRVPTGLLFASDVVGRGMDFPNVDLVIQVGLPVSSEQYIHRVGRTARAGNTGKAIILLTDAETFFLRRNPKLPIRSHPDSAALLHIDPSRAQGLEHAMYSVDELTKQRAYVAYMGFLAGSGLMKPLHLDKAGLVQLCNDFAVHGMQSPEVPAVKKTTIGKMGLKGVPGLRYEANDPSTAPRGRRIEAAEKQYAVPPSDNTPGTQNKRSSDNTPGTQNKRNNRRPRRGRAGQQHAP